MNFIQKLTGQKQFVIDGVNGSETYTSVKGKIGEGAFAYVNRVKNTAGNDYAVKRIVCTTEEHTQEAYQEIELLKQLQSHPNIMPYLGCGKRTNKRSQQEVLLLMPFYSNGTILSICDSGRGYPFSAFSDIEVIGKMLTHIIEGLHHMHFAKGLRHNDLKVSS